MLKKVGMCCAVLALSIGIAVPAMATQNSIGFVSIRADGFQEVPTAVFTDGTAELRLLDRGRNGIVFDFKFNNLQGEIANSVGAHIHFGRRGVTGGIAVFLCGTSQLSGPAGTPSCVSDGRGNGRIHGVIDQTDVLAIDGQGFPGQDLDALRRIIRSGSVYLNVHTDAFPAGEVRGDSRKRFY
jgi:hypothetical protein